jgi:bifunctional DNA-binding transcriptional regulator/antitoxin component of YhaV-PrlF toxin-antitoxin module
VSSQGRVHLPAAARHACRITPGDRVLLAAEPADGVLVVHPLDRRPDLPQCACIGPERRLCARTYRPVTAAL